MHGSILQCCFTFGLLVWGLGLKLWVYNGISRVQHKLPSDLNMSQKRAVSPDSVSPDFSWRVVTLGQMCKVGIHFIIYCGQCCKRQSHIG